MPGLVMEGVVRYTIHGTYEDRPVANIFDMRLFDLGLTERTTAILEQAEDLLNGWTDNVMALVNDEYTATSVSWVDLDTEDGTTGDITSGDGEDWPQTGVLSGNGFPGSTALLITKVLEGGARNLRNGRTYMVGLDESATNANVNVIDAGTVTTYNDAWSQFLEDITNEGVGPAYQSRLVVLHTRNTADPGDPPVIVAVSNTIVDHFQVQARLATQRRRLRG